MYEAPHLKEITSFLAKLGEGCLPKPSEWIQHMVNVGKHAKSEESSDKMVDYAHNCRSMGSKD